MIIEPTHNQIIEAISQHLCKKYPQQLIKTSFDCITITGAQSCKRSKITTRITISIFIELEGLIMHIDSATTNRPRRPYRLTNTINFENPELFNILEKTIDTHLLQT